LEHSVALRTLERLLVRLGERLLIVREEDARREIDARLLKRDGVVTDSCDVAGGDGDVVVVDHVVLVDDAGDVVEDGSIAMAKAEQSTAPRTVTMAKRFMMPVVAGVGLERLVLELVG